MKSWKMKGEATFYNIPTGYHSFYVKCVGYMYDDYKEQTITQEIIR